MQIRQITKQSIDQAIALYTEAFPKIERRPVAQWLDLWQTCNHFRIIEILSDDVFAGFISYWDFEDFIYIEHFATSKSLRGNGIGGKAIDTFKQSCQGKPVVLEVEMPTDDISKHRIAFYNKHGFTLSELPYMQPAYRPCDDPIELRIMSTDPVFTTKWFDKVTGTIHRHVYGVKVK